MSFLILICIGASAAWLVTRLFRHRLPLRDCMRYGMGAGFCFTGLDHFVNGATRYVPMMPSVFAEHALLWVYFTGAAELAGAIGLMVPVSVYKRLRLPNLQRLAGVMLSVLLACVVWANVNVALTGQTVQGLEYGAWYYWTRPLFQPLFVMWALYSVGVLPRRRVPATGSQHFQSVIGS